MYVGGEMMLKIRAFDDSWQCKLTLLHHPFAVYYL